jgi:hypothetical protein
MTSPADGLAGQMANEGRIGGCVEMWGGAGLDVASQVLPESQMRIRPPLDPSVRPLPVEAHEDVVVVPPVGSFEDSRAPST